MRTKRLAIALVGLMGLLVACSSGATPRGTAPEPPSAYDLVLKQVQADGTVSKDTALAAFSLAVAPLPDVPAPQGPRRAIPSGTLAIAWVVQHWAELSPAQQDAVQHALSDGILPAAYTVPDGKPASAPSPDLPCATADSAGAQPYRRQVDAISGDIASQLGRTLTLPIYLEINTKDLEQPSVMYTWACRGQHEEFSGKPTACTIHVNPGAGSAEFDDHDRHSFLAHEIMHCLLYDKFGTPYYGVAEWLREGIPVWVQTALYGADKKATAKGWNEYLKLDKTGLFKRTYDAVGYFAQLASTGTDVWGKIDPMIGAYLSGGNSAAWNTAGAGDAFANSWGPSYARGRHPGRNWDITGYGVPGTKPAVTHFDLNLTPAQAAAPAAGVDLIEVNLATEVVTVAGDAGTQGLFGAADGSERPVNGMIGADFCTKSGGCTCPAGSANEGVQLQALPLGLGYLGITGGLKAATVTLTGSSLADYCAKPRRSCLVGTWTSTNFDIAAGGGAITEHGGAGVMLQIGPDGTTKVDFSPMQPIEGNMADTTMELRYDGTSTGHMTLPPANVTQGNFGDAQGNWDNVVVTATVTNPFRLTLFDHMPVSAVAGLAQGIAGGIGSQPLLGPGGFTCTGNKLVVTPPAGTTLTGTWTLTRAG